MNIIAPGKLREILVAHEKWLESDGEVGKIAELQGANLQGVSLQGANLQEAILQEANLEGADLRRANLHDADLISASLEGADLEKANLQRAVLKDANLQDANLTQANLQDTNLLDCNLREANLQDADLTQAKNLSVKQLVGSTISGAKLPEAIANIIDRLDRVAESSRNARRLFQLMLCGCLYAWLTIATTHDVSLITNSASLTLPIIGAVIPITWFYLVAPLLLFGCYVYFHLHLQRLWEELAFQPAIFPDGKRLDEKAYPWSLNGLVYLYFKRLRNDRPHLSGLQSCISGFLAWGAVPLTLSLFWFRYLTRHDWVWTTFHVILLLASTWAAINFYFLTDATFQGEKNFSWKTALFHVKNGQTCLAIVGIVLFLVPLYSLGTINCGRSEHLYSLLSWKVANIEEMDVSSKPPNWTGKSEDEISLVKGAPLKGRNLQRARASRAFLVNADLRDADLERADLEWANLERANFRGANLQGASLRGANLKGASFKKANLMKANFEGANLQGADLQATDLQEAVFQRANLQGVNLWKADLQRANLVWANLQEASLVWAKLQGVNLKGAHLTGANLKEANLKGAILDGADLRNAISLTKKQIESAHIDDKTKLPDYLQEHFRKQK
jgi:uncharacterized protein YjbI with pentapeptide repeats